MGLAVTGPACTSRRTHLRSHLRPVLAALEARLGTLDELDQTTPIAILAETLGYSRRRLESHARASATTYARYMATRLIDDGASEDRVLPIAYRVGKVPVISVIGVVGARPAWCSSSTDCWSTPPTGREQPPLRSDDIELSRCSR